MHKDNIFQLSNDELSLIKTKKPSKNKLGFAILLKYFQLENRYPKDIKFVDPLMLHTIANQLNIRTSRIDNFDWEGRSTDRYRQEIRGFLRYREANETVIASLKLWLIKKVFPEAIKKSQRIEYAYIYFRENKIEPVSHKELERHINSAHHAFEQQLFESISSKLLNQTKKMIDSILSDGTENDDEDDDLIDEQASVVTEIKFKDLKKDIPGAKLKNVMHAIEKVHFLGELSLRGDLISNLSIKLIKKYYTRVMAERPSGLREYKDGIRYGIFSLFCYFRCKRLGNDIPNLIELNKLREQLAIVFI